MSLVDRASAAVHDRLRSLSYRNELLVLVALVIIAFAASDSLPLGIVSFGVISGAGVLLHAIGVILVYRTGRFINFAQIQIGLIGAGLFTGLVQGQLFIRLANPVCGECIGAEPSQAVLGANFVLAAVLGLSASVFVALVCYYLVVQRFANQPRLVLTIATIFVAQALIALQGKMGDWLTTEDQRDIERINPYAPSPPPWKLNISIDPVELHLDAVLTIAVAVLAVAGISAYLRFTSTGTAVRAAADNAPRARTLGINTSGVTARIWLIVGLVSGAAGILTSMGSGSAGSADSDVVVIPVRMLVLVLAVAVVARFASLTMAALAAVVFGVLQEAAVWSMSSSAPLDAAFVVIIGGLLLLQRYRAGRADTDDSGGWQAVREVRPIPPELRRIPIVRAWTRVGGAVVAVVLIGLPWVLSPSKTNIASIHVLYVIIGVSLLLLTGWAGQVSLGQFAFAALGAWVTATSELPLPAAIVVAGLAGAVAALVVGLPALKLRGLNLAIMTLAFAVSATTLFITTDYLGEHLPTTMPTPTLVGFDVSGQRPFYYLSLVLATLAVVAVIGLRRSRTGRALIATRDNEATAQSYGINLLRTRLTAFAFSGFLAAAAGAMLAFAYGAVTPAAFAPEMSLTLFAFAVIGGLGGVAGPVIGMTYLAILTLLNANELVHALGSGLVGLLVLAALPGGLAQGMYDVRDAMLRRVAARYRLVVPSLFADRDPTSVEDRAPLDEKRTRDRYTPARFEPDDQWALERYGKTGPKTKERIGG